MSETVTVKVKKLFLDAKLPVFSTAGAAGADLYAHISHGPDAMYSRREGDPFIGQSPNSGMRYTKGPYTRIPPGGRAVIGAGIAIEIPPGYEAQVRPRSGLAAKYGISIANTPGTIDSDYRGEVGAILINHGTDSFDVCDGDRIAQIVVKPVLDVEFDEVDNLTDTERGDGRFGSTGVK